MDGEECVVSVGAKHRWVPVGRQHEWCSYCGALKSGYITVPSSYRTLLELKG